MACGHHYERTDDSRFRGIHTHQLELSGNAKLLEVHQGTSSLRIEMSFSGSNNRLGKIAQGILLRRSVLIAATIGRFPDETEMHPSPILHSIGHDRKAFPQIEPSDQLVDSVLERIHLLRVTVVLSPMRDKLIAPVS